MLVLVHLVVLLIQQIWSCDEELNLVIIVI